MCSGPIETVECIWVNIWCMLDWIWSLNCRNTLLLHTAGQLVRSTKSETLFVYPTGAHTYTGWSDIRLQKLGYQWELVDGKKEATIAWCGLSLKRQLFCDLLRYHTLWSWEDLKNFNSNKFLTTISPIISKRSTYFCREAPSFMFDRILIVTLPNNFSKLEEVL